MTAETRVKETGKVVPGLERRAVFLKVRSETKTGQRTVLALVGHVLDGLRALNKQWCRPEDLLFCDYKGDPVPLTHFRFHFNAETRPMLSPFADVLLPTLHRHY